MSDYKAEVLKVAGVYIVRQTWGEKNYLMRVSPYGNIYRTYRVEEAQRFRTKFWAIRNARYIEREKQRAFKAHQETEAVKSGTLSRVWR